MAIMLIGLGGTELELEAATALCGGSHGLRETCGHILRKTSLTGGAHEDIARFDGEGAYGEALERKRALLAELDGGSYAVIDWLYSCGCRGMA